MNMQKFLGYLRTFVNYYQSPKGHRDILDYTRAAVVFLLMTLIVAVIIGFLEGLICA